MSEHDQALLGAYSLGALDPRESHQVDQHLRTCPECRRELGELDAMRNMLGEVPPEAFLEGPPPDGDLLLGRILRAARGEDQPVAPAPKRSRHRATGWRPPALLLVAAAVALVAVFTGGVFAGRQTAPSSVAQGPSVPPVGTRNFSARGSSGVGMSVNVEPASGWVRVQGQFTGVTPGTACQIVLITTSGQRILAGAWLAPPNANETIVTVDGSAIVPPTDVSTVEVDTVAGQRLVWASI